MQFLIYFENFLVQFTSKCVQDFWFPHKHHIQAMNVLFENEICIQDWPEKGLKLPGPKKMVSARYELTFFGASSKVLRKFRFEVFLTNSRKWIAIVFLTFPTSNNPLKPPCFKVKLCISNLQAIENSTKRDEFHQTEGRFKETESSAH